MLKLAISLATVLCLLAIPGVQAEPAFQAPYEIDQQTTPSPMHPLYRIYRDPETGKLTSTAPPAAAGFAISNRTLYKFSTSDINLIPEIRPDGTQRVDLRGRFRQGSAIVRDTDGNTRILRLGGDMFTSPEGAQIQADVTAPKDHEPEAAR